MDIDLKFISISQMDQWELIQA